MANFRRLMWTRGDLILVQGQNWISGGTCGVFKQRSQYSCSGGNSTLCLAYTRMSYQIRRMAFWACRTFCACTDGAPPEIDTRSTAVTC
jgi:hypothetical protein